MIFKNDFLVDAMSVFKSIVSLRKRRLNGFAMLFFAVVRKDAAEHTIEHEKVHIRQFWRNPAMYFWVAFTNKYALELEAYRVSVQYGRDVNSAAQALSIYNGGDVEAAKKDLLN
jgi:hypothetical protein